MPPRAKAPKRARAPTSGAVGPTPEGGFTVFEYAKRIRQFRKAVYKLPPDRLALFLARWPEYEMETDPLMWNDDKTALAVRYWRDVTGTDVPDHLRPPTFADVRAVRTRTEAIEIAKEVQRRQAGFTATTTLQAGSVNRGGHKRHDNDLRNHIFHDARDMLSMPAEAVLFLAGHEAGHTKFYPCTQARMQFDIALMEMHDARGSKKWFAQAGRTWGGYGVPSLFINFVGDQIINYRFQFYGAFGEQFHKGHWWLLTHDNHLQETKGSSWFFKMHFRLLWASAIRRAGGYHAQGQFVPIQDVSEIPPLVSVEGRAYPQVTFHDGADHEWLRLPDGRYRLVELWKAINTVSPTNIRRNLTKIMDLAEPFFFPPRGPNSTPQNPDGIPCPRCRKVDQVRIVPRYKTDPDNPTTRLPKLKCLGCLIHKSTEHQGVYEFDRDTNRNERVLVV
jgi:hypothetical protein